MMESQNLHMRVYMKPFRTRAAMVKRYRKRETEIEVERIFSPTLVCSTHGRGCERRTPSPRPWVESWE